jgi:hypothetical protein
MSAHKMRDVLILQRMMQRYGKYTRKSILPLRGYGKYTRIYGDFLIKKRRYKKIILVPPVDNQQLMLIFLSNTPPR